MPKSQNHNRKITINVFSLRAKEHPTVSAPIPWDEVEASVKRMSRECLNFEAADVIIRLKKRRGLVAPVLSPKQQLPGHYEIAAKHSCFGARHRSV